LKSILSFLVIRSNQNYLFYSEELSLRSELLKGYLIAKTLDYGHRAQSSGVSETIWDYQTA
jgi:hypothetical protein